MKMTKSVCLDFDTHHVIEKVMKKYSKNYSVSIELIINQWVRFQRERNEMLERIELERKKEKLKSLQTAKVLKNEK